MCSTIVVIELRVYCPPFDALVRLADRAIVSKGAFISYSSLKLFRPRHSRRFSLYKKAAASDMLLAATCESRMRKSLSTTFGGGSWTRVYGFVLRLYFSFECALGTKFHAFSTDNTFVRINNRQRMDVFLRNCLFRTNSHRRTFMVLWALFRIYYDFHRELPFHSLQ